MYKLPDIFLTCALTALYRSEWLTGQERVCNLRPSLLHPVKPWGAG